MKKTISFSVLLIILFTFFSSCRKKGCTDSAATNYDAKARKNDGSCTYPAPIATGNKVTFLFSHNYNGTPVSSADFNDLKFTNAFGSTHSILTLDYLISDIRLYKANGDSILFDGYNFINLNNNNSLTYLASTDVASDTYTGIGFNLGFDVTDNTTGAYPDLNTANWSWPSMLGGGYHNLKFEGKYINTITDTINFAYHMGTAREITVTDTIYHPNHIFKQLPNSGFTLSNDATIEIKMNIAEWFTTPNIWDLNTYFEVLMPNYTAQVMMNQNGQNVFSLGTITQ